MEAKRLLEFQSITKSFGGTQALRDVSIDLREGEILALLGKTAPANRRSSRRLRVSTSPTAATSFFAARATIIVPRSRTSGSRLPSSTRISV